jgi:hypothetical protein
MTRAKAIKQNCFECSGDSHKEVTLCCVPGCPLYPYRFGNSAASGAYKTRMRLAKKRYPEEYAEAMALQKANS